MVVGMKSFVLPHTRAGKAFRVDRSLPANDASWKKYSVRATARKAKRELDDDWVEYKVFDCDGEQINWEGHASPDMLPLVDQLHPTEAQVLAFLWHRVYANQMTDTKVSNEEIGAAIGRHPRTVARCMARLTKLGFIGVCHTVFGSGKEAKTLRMIRVHAAGFLMRWDTWESPTWFRTDIRPDVDRYKPSGERYTYNARVGLSGRLPSGWALRQAGMIHDRATGGQIWCEPKIDPFQGALFTGLKLGWIPNQWYNDHQAILDDHEYGEPYAIQVLGRRKMKKDLNDPQLVR